MKHYSAQDGEMWPIKDVEATSDFMQNTLSLIDFTTRASISDVSILESIETISKYFKNVATPSGVLVKSTGQGIVQTCRALSQLVKNLISNDFGISCIETQSLLKGDLWLEEVEHNLAKDKSRMTRIIPDDILPPKILNQVTHSNTNLVLEQDQASKKKGRKRKLPELEENAILFFNTVATAEIVQ